MTDQGESTTATGTNGINEPSTFLARLTNSIREFYSATRKSVSEFFKSVNAESRSAAQQVQVDAYNASRNQDNKEAERKPTFMEPSDDTKEHRVITLPAKEPSHVINGDRIRPKPPTNSVVDRAKSNATSDEFFPMDDIFPPLDNDDPHPSEGPYLNPDPEQAGEWIDLDSELGDPYPNDMPLFNNAPAVKPEIDHSLEEPIEIIDPAIFPQIPISTQESIMEQMVNRLTVLVELIEYCKTNVSDLTSVEINDLTLETKQEILFAQTNLKALFESHKDETLKQDPEGLDINTKIALASSSINDLTARLDGLSKDIGLTL